MLPTGSTERPVLQHHFGAEAQTQGRFESSKFLSRAFNESINICTA